MLAMLTQQVVQFAREYRGGFRHVRENHGVMVLDCSGETVSIEVDQFNWNRVWGWWSCGVAVLLVSTTSSRAWSFRMAWP